MRRWLVSVLIGGALGWSAPSAGAQDPGVTIDPDSPSGREYDIPLENARRGAEPGRNPDAPVSQGRRVAPRFGAGISSSPGDASGTEQNARSRDGADSNRRDDDETPPAKAVKPPAAVQVAAANPGAPAGGAGTSALVISGGAIVLAAGAGAGFLLRRRASRS